MTDFLQNTPWAKATRSIVSGDASFRSYDRLQLPSGETAILMTAPPSKGEDTRPFIRIAQHLTHGGLSAPRILEQDIQNGFLLLEDLGDDLFDRVCAQNPLDERQLYEVAIDVLDHIQTLPLLPDIPAYDPADMADKACLVAQWYDTDLPSADLRSVMQGCLERLNWDSQTLALRDYHAQNLLWLPGRQSPARVGLLDFQDAQPSHPAYDLVSLLFDARRDVSFETRSYLLKKACRKDDFEMAIPLLLIQRSLRVMGVFARLWLRDGKPSYLDLLPRVYGHLTWAMDQDIPGKLRELLNQIAPPTPEKIKMLRDHRQ
ncbi:MAG: aminoglycoside phosphotransferase family protein [Planktomarina sp.]